jgi:hypothetical protein
MESMNAALDPYEVLGVTPQASDAEIKKAYRKLALKLHPDKAGAENEDAAEKMKEVNNANDILSDPERRQHYDMYGDAGVPEPEQEPLDPEVVARMVRKREAERMQVEVTGTPFGMGSLREWMKHADALGVSAGLFGGYESMDLMAVKVAYKQRKEEYEAAEDHEKMQMIEDAKHFLKHHGVWPAVDSHRACNAKWNELIDTTVTSKLEVVSDKSSGLHGVAWVLYESNDGFRQWADGVMSGGKHYMFRGNDHATEDNYERHPNNEMALRVMSLGYGAWEKIELKLRSFGGDDVSQELGSPTDRAQLEQMYAGALKAYGGRPVYNELRVFECEYDPETKTAAWNPNPFFEEPDDDVFGLVRMPDRKGHPSWEVMQTDSDYGF